MKFPGNCLVVALVASLRPGNRLRTKRNPAGRVHWYWQRADGSAWEFYRRGASRRTYWQNAVYWGEVKRVR